ncbi:carbohydrate kinase [Vibrio nigripulchritudo]|nr:carbohydrate kinase [Vibrio nigripulchritudo]BDU44026.1 carbohydrate kinase [Vibrio nigripulchritudo]
MDMSADKITEPLVMGIDAGTGGLRIGVFNADGDCRYLKNQDYSTHFPRPGWAEQSPEDWWNALVSSVQALFDETDISPAQIRAVAVDGTASTVVCVDEHGESIGPAILWMDARASDQAENIFRTGHPALERSSAGVSSEMMLPKLLWLKEHDPERFAQSRYFMEEVDFLTMKLSGVPALSINHITHRWFYNPRTGGWPHDFYQHIGLENIVEKFPERVLPMGESVGNISAEVAALTGLSPDTIIAMGGCDAYVGMLGLNAIRKNQAALITGSSHVFLPMSDSETPIKGVFGPHPDCVIPGLTVYEGGQVSSGSIIKWYNDNFIHEAMFDNPGLPEKDTDKLEKLTQEAKSIPIGSEGLIVLDYWQGNRTPHTDYKVQGAVWGLTLKHGKAHVYRAICESIAYATESMLTRLRKNGVHINAMYFGGGFSKSEFSLQLHADVSNVEIHIPEFTEATVLGSAICAAKAAGFYDDLVSASDNMVTITKVIKPNPKSHQNYQFYFDLYERTYDAMMPLMHEMAERPDS